MPRSTTSPAARYANNLKILLKVHDKTVAQVASAAKVIPKQVYNLLNESHDPRVKGLEKVASAFDLSAWQMLAIDMTDKPAENRQILALLEHFSHADEAGRATIMQIAELAATKVSKA